MQQQQRHRIHSQLHPLCWHLKFWGMSLENMLDGHSWIGSTWKVEGLLLSRLVKVESFLGKCYEWHFFFQISKKCNFLLVTHSGAHYKVITLLKQSSNTCNLIWCNDWFVVIGMFVVTEIMWKVFKSNKKSSCRLISYKTSHFIINVC